MGAGGLERLEDRLLLAGDLAWARQLRSPDFHVRTVDSSGNLLVTSLTGLAKWSPTGRVSWSWSQGVTPLDVETDAAGNVYLCGTFMGEKDLDPTRGRTVIGTGRRTLPNPVHPGTDFESDAFVAKLDPGGRLLWARSLPSPGFADAALNLGLDDSGGVTVSGRFSGRAVFAHGDGTRQVMVARGVARDHGMAQDAFVWRLDSGGRSIWARQLDLGVEDPRNTTPPYHEMDVDAAGNVYLAGGFSGEVDFDPSRGGRAILKASQTIRDGADGAVLKLDSRGNFAWARRTGGFVFELEADDGGNAYVVGGQQRVGVMDAAWGSRRFLARDGFAVVFKVTPDGGLAWAGQTNAFVMDISVSEGGGDLYLTGNYAPVDDFDLGPGRLEVKGRPGFGDAFVWKVNAGGGTQWVRNLGGNERDVGFSVAAGPNGTVHVGGMFFGRADVDPGPGKTIFEETSFSAGQGGIFGGVGHVETFNNGFLVKLRD